MKRHVPFILCLILPLVALYQLSAAIDWQFILSYAVVISALSVGLNWKDKRSAEQGGGHMRVSEKTLHLCEFLGGWPAAYIAQQALRHKSSKRPYRVVYWCIVGFHQCLAFEWISAWRISRWLGSFLQA